jgi:hypothetical protein
MGHKFKKLICLLAAGLMLFQVVPVHADQKGTSNGREYYRTEVINNVSIGDINISLDEYERDANGNLVPYENNKLVVPNQTVSKVAQVTNLANDAWIRIRVDFEYEDGMIGVDKTMLNLANDEWLNKGEYYYWPYPVAHGEVIDFLESVHVPEEWNSWYANKQFRIIITADAVQVRNFTPKFDEDDPWFGTVIEQCVHDERMDTSTTGDAEFSVVFKGGAEGLVKVGDDFFSNWAEMMPGDTWEDVVSISNKYNRGVRIWFYTETIADDILIKELILTIRQGSKIIYQGPLSGTVDKTLLGEFNPGAGAELTYSLYVPWELNNKYALTNTKTKWIFECELLPEGKDVNPVDTGDFTSMNLYIILGATAVVLAIALISKKRRRYE